LQLRVGKLQLFAPERLNPLPIYHARFSCMLFVVCCDAFHQQKRRQSPMTAGFFSSVNFFYQQALLVT